MPLVALLNPDWSVLQGAVSGDVVLPGSPEYDSARKPAIARFDDVRPQAIVLCQTPADVSETISFARRSGLRTATRSGGHCFAGRSSTEGIVIDVSPMRSVSVSGSVATVGAGARLGEVYDALAEHGLTIPAGCGPSVGISGLTLGGGFGILGQKYGLTSDHLLEAQVVLADGHITIRRKMLLRMYHLFTALLVLSAATLPTLAVDGGAEPVQAAAPGPQVILAQRPAFAPEGIEYDAQHARFLLSSLAEGTIYATDLNGNVTPFIQDANLKATAGLEIDMRGNRLLVANVDLGVLTGAPVQGVATSVAAYDLSSGKRLFFTDLSNIVGEGRHFANDLTVDASGNTYVTDSFAPVIYKITPTGTASVFATSPLFRNASFGLNGIVFHRDGYLLAGVSGSGQDGGLFKVLLNDPRSVTQVTLDFPINPDGMLLTPDGQLVVVNQILSSVYRLASMDGWVSALRTGVFEVPQGDEPTTAALRGTEVYVLYARLATLGRPNPPSAYEVVKVDFTRPR